MNSESNKTVEILLVEDNIGDILLIQEAFLTTHFKHKLRVAKNGEEALNILLQNDEFSSAPLPDLIILDLNLPKIDGREVLEKIKSNFQLADIPVVILSGSAAETDMTTSYDLHANSYIIKPATFDDFKEIAAAIENYWFKGNTLSSISNNFH